ncbi:alpha-L-fucosidase [Phenylobacterium montanum]|uniref:alpha-L-fucosidase n=1 Tax=Phenylobacterium montanum TaxID=2823693 RepID=A0A975IUZ8_9CAUL|nr:alpha-L-fucosidase [Caulobacter sp. S6]QUD88275.1 alpha-L-fucosidase [Caulobacter sp. S6]
MSLSRRRLLQASAVLGAIPGRAAAQSGPFQPSWDSLIAQYRAPDWYRDAKLGIWAHWSAQCVPEFGDWYGRLMYVQGNPYYEHHLRTYGHPSRTGFMQIENLWRAENWEPERLMRLYKAAGAKYFVALANHHDNLDTWASKHHAWNTLRVGPKKDIVGTWAKVAREHGLRFGVSNHSAHAWHWWQTAYGYDAEGPLAGQRYDAFRLTKADGAGQWWEGLDPQELYTGPHMVVPDGVTSIKAMDDWHGAHDGQWLETPPPGDPAYALQWKLRCMDLVSQHRPDFLYLDDERLPLGQAGLDATAWYYNQNQAWHGGSLEAVVTAKKLIPAQRRGVVEDVERGLVGELRPEPWQTDTCIGNWHYDRALYERHGYKSAKAVIQSLADIVSKNGNLLLSIPLRADGTIDSDEERILADMAAWMAVNGEAIFATRPWRTFGEGPTPVAAGSFSEAQVKPFTAEDIRYTTRKGALYALAMEWPSGALTLKALAGVRVERVTLLGGGPLAFEAAAEGLKVRLPDTRPAFSPALKIEGAGIA